MAPSIRLFIVTAALLCCFAAQTAAASKLPPQCLRAASAVCHGESAHALACLKNKALEGNIAIPMACATALKALDDSPEAPRTRVAQLDRLLTEAASCDHPTQTLTCATAFACPAPQGCCCINGGTGWSPAASCCAN